MSLEAYLRGKTWWAKGRVELNGRFITDYIRESTESATAKGAEDWIDERTNLEIRRHLLGDEAQALTFADATVLYESTPDMAKYLMPIVAEIGDLRISGNNPEVTAKLLRDLGKKLYPNNATDTWRRWVIAPARAVINNAHDLGKCGAIKVKGYTNEERIAQDKARKKPSRVERMPGSWEWLLQFRQHASRRHGALALFMFITGARIGQSVAMHPKAHLDLQNARVCIPGAKGLEDRWLTIPMELVVELANLAPKTPRSWEKKPANLRVFGWASKDGPRKGWIRACTKAKIPYLPPHSAGRHGFGQEMNVRQPVDEKVAGKFGGWRDTALMKRTYTHAEDVDAKIGASFRTGLEQAEAQTGLRLLAGGKNGG